MRIVPPLRASSVEYDTKRRSGLDQLLSKFQLLSLLASRTATSEMIPKVTVNVRPRHGDPDDNKEAVVFSEVGCQAATGCTSNAGADLLNRRHERVLA
jgi:hypothetical protein